jgi:hypothetical protein
MLELLGQGCILGLLIYIAIIAGGLLLFDLRDGWAQWRRRRQAFDVSHGLAGIADLAGATEAGAAGRDADLRHAGDPGTGRAG